ncbi:hypothetical protein EJB05_37805, partial [Eragrostis curvula]
MPLCLASRHSAAPPAVAPDQPGHGAALPAATTTRRTAVWIASSWPASWDPRKEPECHCAARHGRGDESGSIRCPESLVFPVSINFTSKASEEPHLPFYCRIYLIQGMGYVDPVCDQHMSKSSSTQKFKLGQLGY